MENYLYKRTGITNIVKLGYLYGRTVKLLDTRMNKGYLHNEALECDIFWRSL